MRNLPLVYRKMGMQKRANELYWEAYSTPGHVRRYKLMRRAMKLEAAKERLR